MEIIMSFILQNQVVKMKKVSFLFLFVFVFCIGNVFAGVYFYDESNPLSAEMENFDSNGEINVDDFKGIIVFDLDSPEKGIKGEFKNILIKKEGDLNFLEFKEKGLIKRVSLDGSFSENYEGISQGGRVYFNQEGKVVKADFVSNQDNSFYFEDYGYDVSAGSRVQFDDGKFNVEIGNGGFVNYFKKDSDKKVEYGGIKNGGKLEISKGKLINADFEVLKKGGFIFGKYKFNLGKGTHVLIKDGNVDFKFVDGSQIEEPEIIGEGDDYVFSYQSEGDLVLPNGKSLKSESGLTVVNFDENGFYLNDGDFVLSDDDLLVHSSSELYLFFNKADIDDSKNYLYVDESRLELGSLNGEGGSVFFKEGNELVDTDSLRSLSVQAKNGKVIVEKILGEDLSSVRISGESIAMLDSRNFYGQDGELYFEPSGDMVSGDFSHGNLDVPVRLSFIDNNDNQLKDFEVYSNGKDQYAAVGSDDFQGDLGYYKTGGGFYVSSDMTFNYLTPEAQEFYADMDAKKQNELIAYFESDKGVVRLQNVLDELIIEEERLRQNPIQASVRIPTKGGSGTIVGIDKDDGRAIVATCGHGSGSYAGSRHRVQLSDGREFRGVSLGYAGTHVSGNDITLIKLDSPVEDIPYMPVASENHNVNKGDIVLRIGCPGCGAFKQTQTTINQYDGNSMVGTQDSGGYVIGGESGGGLFHQGRLIGIVSMGGGSQGWYTSTDDIRDFVRKNGYDYLIKIIIILLD